jgi:hypothetical protein
MLRRSCRKVAPHCGALTRLPVHFAADCLLSFFVIIRILASSF